MGKYYSCVLCYYILPLDIQNYKTTPTVAMYNKYAIQYYNLGINRNAVLTNVYDQTIHNYIYIQLNYLNYIYWSTHDSNMFMRPHLLLLNLCPQHGSVNPIALSYPRLVVLEFYVFIAHTVKLGYIEVQGTWVNTSIYKKFDITEVCLWMLISWVSQMSDNRVSVFRNILKTKFMAFITICYIHRYITWKNQWPEFVVLSLYCSLLMNLWMELTFTGSSSQNEIESPCTPVNDHTWPMLRCGWVLQARGWILVSMLTFLRLLAMVNMIYSTHLSHLYSTMNITIETLWKIIQSLFSSITFLSL